MAHRSDARLDRGIIVVSAVVVIGAFMSILDTTIVNVALASLSRELHSPLHTIQWVATGYLVALAVVIPMTGWASERFGATRLWLAVVALFIVGSTLCGLASSAGSLIFFRVLQGLGGGMIMPAGMTILVEAAGPQRIGRVMSIVGVPMLLGPVFGPVLGGLILQDLSWNWIFFVNVPIGLVALVLGFRLLPRSEPRPCERLDLRGVALLSPGLAAIVFGLSETSSQGGLAYVGAWGPIVGGLALVAAFVWHALGLRGRQPLLDLRLFGSPAFAAATAAVLLIGAATFGALLVLPLYFQVARGASTLATGLLLAPQGIGAALVMPISGRMTDRIGGGVVSVFGLAVMTIATIGLTQITAHTPYSVTSAILVVRGVGLGCSMMPATAAAYATVSRAAVPRATTLINVFQRVGGSIGTALLAVVLEDQIKATAPRALGYTGGAVEPLPAAVREPLATPLGQAFAHTFWWAVGLTALAIVPAVVLAVKSRVRVPLVPSAQPVAEARDGSPQSSLRNAPEAA
jgi:EmrB/QacA subfamily drug resistance transporter